LRASIRHAHSDLTIAVARFGLIDCLIDMRAQAEVHSALRTDTPRSM
jgi:hypothetical protein